MEKKKTNKIFYFILFIGILIIVLLILLSDNRYLNINDNSHTTTTKTCSPDFELIDGKCQKVLETKEATKKYYCDENYSLDNTNCIKYEYANVIYNEYCDDGYSKGFGDYPSLCHKRITKNLDVCGYFCDSGYHLSGETCHEVMYSVGVLKPIEKYCSGPGTGNPCVYHSYDNKCPYGYYQFDWMNKQYHPYSSITCYESLYYFTTCGAYAYMDNGVCVSKVGIPANKMRGCHGDYEISSDESYCYKDDYKIPHSSFTCPNGYILDSNGACVKTEVKEASFILGCEDGYILNNDSCYLYEYE